MMLLTKKKDILEAMHEDLDGASASTISWLAEEFNVPMPATKTVPKRKSIDYSSRVIKKKMDAADCAKIVGAHGE